jgi:hypothetical protein
MEFYGLGICPACSTVHGRKGVYKDFLFGVWVPGFLLYTMSVARVQKYVISVARHKTFEKRDDIYREATNAQLSSNTLLTWIHHACY